MKTVYGRHFGEAQLNLGAEGAMRKQESLRQKDKADFTLFFGLFCNFAELRLQFGFIF